jgi:hypothetical protein
MFQFTDEFKQLIEEQLLLHYNLYPLLPCNDKHWEHIEYNAFKAIGLKPQWLPNSHQQGMDIELNGIRISNKSGKEIKLKTKSRHTMHYSSFRTQKHRTLEEKINFISKYHEDVIHFMCNKENELAIEYKIMSIDANKINFRDLTWGSRDSSQDLHGLHKTNHEFFAKISYSTSHQLWVDIPWSWLKEELRIVIKK